MSTILRLVGFAVLLFAASSTVVQAADDAATTIAEAMDKQPDAFAEAKKWLADEKAHVLGPTSKMKRADVKKLVDELYAAGAVRVYFIGLEKADGVEKSQLLTIVLPSAPAVRTKIAGVIDAYYAAYLPTVGLADLVAGLKYQEANQPVHPMNLAF